MPDLDISGRDNKVYPFKAFGENRGEEIRISNAFRIVSTFGLILGLPLPIQFSSPERSRMTNLLASFLLNSWIVLLSVAKTVLFLVTSFYGLPYLYAFGIPANNILYCLFGFITMWAFITNRRKIRDLTEKISRLQSILNSDDDAGTSMVFHLIWSVLLIDSLFIVQIQYFLFSQWDSFVNMVMLVHYKLSIPFMPDNYYFDFYCAFVFSSAIVTFVLGYLMLFVTLFFCGTVYRSLSELFVLYGKKMRQDIRMGHFAAFENIRLFNDIILSVNEMNSIFRPFTLFIYTEIFMICFRYYSLAQSPSADLSTLMDVLSNLNRSGIMRIPAVVTFTAGTFALFYFHFSGETISTESENLKKELVGISSSLMSHSPDTRTLVMYNLLCNHIRDQDAAAKALNVYNIKARFIPGIVVALIAYSFLHQIIVAIYKQRILSLDQSRS